MNLAIKNAAAKNDVKKLLGKELLTTYDQLQHDFYAEFNEEFEEGIRESFTQSREVLQ